jgi:hypothetical protein
MTAGRIVSVLPAPPATAQPANLPGTSLAKAGEAKRKDPTGGLMALCCDPMAIALRRVTPSL